MNSRGIALIMGLVLLAAISALALASARGMVLQHRMASNAAEDLEALHNATLASAAARAWLDSRADIERDAGCMVDCLLPFGIRGPGELPPRPELEGAAWWRDSAYLVGLNPETGDDLGYRSGGEEPARWIIDELAYLPLDADALEGAVGGVGYYRVFARGTGKRRSSVAVSESIVARPWGGDYEPAPYPPDDPPEPFCRQFDASVACGMLAWRQRK